MLHIKVKKRLVMSKLMDRKLLTLIIHVVANTMRFTILRIPCGIQNNRLSERPSL